MATKMMPVGSIVRGTKGQYSGKVYVVVETNNIFQLTGMPLARAEEQRIEAKKKGRYFLYTLKNKDSTIKVWDYLLTGAGGQQPSFERVAGKYGIDELTKNNEIARRNKERDDRMNRYKFNTNTPYDKYDKDWSYDKWSAGSNA